MEDINKSIQEKYDKSPAVRVLFHRKCSFRERIFPSFLKMAPSVSFIS